jgi:hypothetical protein
MTGDPMTRDTGPLPGQLAPCILPPPVLDPGTGAAVTAGELLDHLAGPGSESLRLLGFRTRLQILARAGSRFLDPADPLRREALERLPEEAHLSRRGAEELLDGMARDWTLDRLATAIRADFPDPDVLDGFRPGVRGDRLRVVPPRLLVQVGAGNVPGTGATALLRGLLVGAATLLKPGAGDLVLPELMARALQAESDPLARALAVTGWKGGEGGALERAALRRADRVVVYGGEEAVAAVRALTGPLTPVVVYGPRVSAGLVLRDATGSKDVVEDAAAAIVAYEQRGCVSPHLVWIQPGGLRSPEAWAEALAFALARRPGDAPPSARPVHAMRALREAAEFRGAAGRHDRVWGGPAEGWMVLYEEDAGGERPRPFEPSCLGRTVRVRPLPDPGELARVLAPVRSVVQSVALEGAEPGRTTTALILARAGVTRVTTFRDQPWPPAWWKHDGRGPLAALVQWVTLEPADRAGPP